jgi:DNA modification methylase
MTGIVEIGDATHLPLDDETIHVFISSPPYNVKIPYAHFIDDLALKDYLIFTIKWMKEAYRVLVPGGRACINIANTGRKPYLPLNAYVMMIALRIGFKIRGEIIWNKGDAVARGKTACGSWKNTTNPVTRDCHEYIEMLTKGTYKMDCTGYPKADITPTEFSDNTVSIWNIPPAHVQGHPVPFPIELATRCIKLYTRPGMNVLDPFCGSGQTMIAAKRCGRNYYGYDIDPDYVELTNRRLNDLNLTLNQAVVI